MDNGNERAEAFGGEVIAAGGRHSTTSLTDEMDDRYGIIWRTFTVRCITHADLPR
jgi:hypothetical protein